MTGRARLRRRLLLWSALPAVAVLLVAAKMASVVVAGDAAKRHFVSGDVEALRTDVRVLQVFDVIEPATTLLAAGDLAVLQGRLAEADQLFGQALGHRDACPVRVNLELVRETLGDKAAGRGDFALAERSYTGALAVVDAAAGGCFSGNDDPDPQRREIRERAAERLKGKLGALPAAVAPPPPPPPSPAENAAPPPPPPAADAEDEPAPDAIPLQPVDPMEQLQQILRDAQRAAG